jgi:hypothetical protein
MDFLLLKISLKRFFRMRISSSDAACGVIDLSERLNQKDKKQMAEYLRALHECESKQGGADEC